MKIGIQILAYQCENVIDKVLNPWLKLKSEYEVVFWVSSGQFKIYSELGYENKNERTLEILKSMLEKGEIDFLFTTSKDELLSDHETRDMCVEYFKKNDVDLMVQLDSDEFYTEQDVYNFIKFIEENNQYTIYNTVFKNLVGDGSKYNEWSRFSAGWIKRHGGIKGYYFDAHWSFNGEDGKNIEYRNTPSITIPKEILNPIHDTWTDQRSGSSHLDTKAKIRYQEKYYSHECGWSWDNNLNTIVPNQAFWGNSVPILKSYKK